jgi:hypothetical protein
MWMATEEKGTMKKPTHVNILGVDILLATLRYATWDAPVYATIGEYNNYYSESSPELAEAIREFEEARLRNSTELPAKAGKNYQFFNYNTFSESVYEGSI